MKRKYINNFISSILIMSFIVPMQFIIFVNRAEATTAKGIGAYLGQIAPVIDKLPLCQDKLGGKIKNLFTKAKAAGEYNKIPEGALDTSKSSTPEDFDKVSEEYQNQAEAVPTYDYTLHQISNEIKKDTKETKDKISDLEANDTCFKSIGRFLANLALRKIALSTVNWINTGFEGKPFFIQNPKAFAADISRTEILRINLEIQDPVKFPFGKNFIKQVVNKYQRGYAENAEYTLDKLIQINTPGYSADSFQGDFSSGGWAAWRATTSVDSNNPFGFYIRSSNELQRRLDTEAEELKQKLLQGNGFLGFERCSDPNDVTRESERAALKKGEKDSEGNIIGVCKSNKWVTLTPGQLVAQSATNTIKHPENSYLNVDDLNTSIAAILDAVLNQFTSRIQIDGFSEFPSGEENLNYTVDPDSSLDGDDSQTVKDFSRFQLGTQFLQDNPDFNLRTDLTQPIIDTQRTFQEKLEAQNKILNDLNKTILQLDYCIPGPHPGWEKDSREVLSGIENVIVSKSLSDVKDLDRDELNKILKGTAAAGAAVAGAAIGAAIGSAVPGIGTAIGLVIGLLAGLIIDLFTGDNSYEKLSIYYAGIVNQYTGIHLDRPHTDSSKLANKQEVTNALDTIFHRYSTLIYKYYPLDSLPTVAKDASREFKKLIGYNQIIKNNNINSTTLDGVIKRLGTMKDTVDDLNIQLATGKIDATKYEEELKPLFGEFSRLSASMVTGDNIAQVDSISKQAREEIVYVYDLLKSDSGCEKDIELNRQPLIPGAEKLTWKIKGTRRATYPFEVWYDYNKLSGGADIPDLPDEFKKEYLDKNKPTIINKMPDYDKLLGFTAPNGPLIDYAGPGFLSTVFYGYDEDVDFYESAKKTNPDAKLGCSEGYGQELDCISIADLFLYDNTWPVTVGRNLKSLFNGVIPETTNEQRFSSFEQTILIY